MERKSPVKMLPDQKTKIVATIGPASESSDVMEAMIKAGMNIARINLAHGDYDGHKQVIDKLRVAARTVGQRIAVMADLPGIDLGIGAFTEKDRECLKFALEQGVEAISQSFC